MDFDRGEIGRTSGQAVGRRAVVVDDEIAGADLRALRRRASPGLFNHDVPGLELLGEGGRGAYGEGERQGEKRRCLIVRPFRLLDFGVDLRRSSGSTGRHGFTVNSKVPWV